jgi:uncharacterized membrane protein YoaK (UPF0700 family)
LAERAANTVPATGIRLQLVLLGMAAGSMDVLSYLQLGHVFTSAMTGNAVLLGLGIGQGNLAATSRNLAALGSFLLGLALGGVLLKPHGAAGASPTARRDVTRAFTLEAVLLIGFAALWQFGGGPSSELLLYELIGLSALAMGLQSATAHHIGIPGMATTYFTGTLTNIVAAVTAHLRHARRPDMAAAPSARRTRWQALAFLAYIAAAALTGLMAAPSFRLAGGVAALPAVALLLVLLTTYWSRGR